MTPIIDTIYTATGSTAAAGSFLLVKWPRFTSSGAHVVPPNELKVVLNDGVFAISLEPSTDATFPFRYTVEYHLICPTGPLAVYCESWDVPDTATTQTIAEVLVQEAPSPANNGNPPSMKGDLATSDGLGVVRLPAPASPGYVLQTNPSESTGLEWTPGTTLFDAAGAAETAQTAAETYTDQQIATISLTPGPQGPAGAAGPAGPAGAQGQAGPTGVQGPTGVAGESAYQLAVDQGYTGTLAQWLTSLIGPQGPAGSQGPAGATGPQGATGAQGPAGPSPAGSANQVLATPDGASGTASLRPLVTADLPTTAALISGIQQGSYVYGLDTGSANAYAVAVSPAPTLTAGLLVMVKIANANTAASTLSVNGSAAQAIYKGGANPLQTGDLYAGQIASFIFDGTYFQLLSPGGNNAWGESTFTAPTVGMFTQDNFIGGTTTLTALPGYPPGVRLADTGNNSGSAGVTGGSGNYTNLRNALVAIPTATSNFQVTARLRRQSACRGGYNTYGLILKDSISGRYVTFGWVSGSIAIQGNYFPNATSASASTFNGDNISYDRDLWFRIYSNSGTLYFQISKDGSWWGTCNSTSATAYLTNGPNYAGFGLNADNDGAGALMNFCLDCASFSLVNI